jgi:hypothetical protein
MRVDGGIVLQGKARNYQARIRLGCLLSISLTRFFRIISGGFLSSLSPINGRGRLCLYLILSIVFLVLFEVTNR